MKHNAFVRHVHNGNCAVLFIHGFLGSPNHFSKFLETVPDSVAVYNVLLEGHGGTVSDFSAASMKKWKNQTERIADELCDKYKNVLVVAHSMGTFFAMEAAIKHPDKISGIMLLQTPLVVGIKPVAVKYSIKSLFGLVGEDDEVGKAYMNAHGVSLNLKLWQYLGWIPRYTELLRESHAARKRIASVEVPVFIFQSKKDELVSSKTLKHIPKKDNIKVCTLTKSAHFIYDKTDFSSMLETFLHLLETMQKQ